MKVNFSCKINFQTSTGYQWSINDGTLHGGLRISGSIKKSISGDQNTAKLDIANLSQQAREILEIDERTRAESFRDGKGIMLVNAEIWAGYNGVLNRVFSGNITSASSVSSNPGWSTSVTIQDGAAAYSMQLGETLPQGLSGKGIISNILGSIGDIGASDDADIQDGGREPYTVYGNPVDLARHITGKNVFIIDNKVFMLGKRAGTYSAVPIINAASGLKGTPKIQDQYVTLNIIFEGQLVPGNLVEVEARGFKYNKMQFQIRTVSHTIDNYGDNATELQLSLIPLV